MSRHRLLSFLLLILLAAGCGESDRPDREKTSGTSGVPDSHLPITIGAAPEPTGTLQTPSGRLIESGTRDALGYILPLDVRRPRPPFAQPAPPARAAILAARSATESADFPEHRLGPDDGHTQNETSIAAHGDTIVAGWNNYTGTNLVMGIGRSIDGGDTWTWNLIEDQNVFSDPVLDYDIYVRRSLDGGATWGGPSLVTQNTWFDDKPYMDARGDEVLVGYAAFNTSPSRVNAARSLDGGQTFQHDTMVAVRAGSGNGACPVIAPDGDYFMFWRDSYQESLWVTRSTDQGTTWSADHGIVDMHPLPSSYPPGYRIVNLPSADADPLTGDLLVVWNDQRLGNPDILAIRSTDDGQSWSTPVRVNDDAGNAVQFFPWVTFDEGGVAHVVWYDRRANGSDIDVYYAASMDGGQSFEANTRVTATPFTPLLPWDFSTPFIGDYNGIAATSEGVYPCYQDAREGNQDVYVAVLPGSAAGIVGGEPTPTAEGSPGAERRSRLTASPNPFRDGTRIGRTEGAAGAGSAGGTAVVEVISVAGRRLRRLALDGAGKAIWDGRDADGRIMPRGVYFARLGSDDQRALRIVKLD